VFALLTKTLVLAGALILMGALMITRRLITALPVSTVRNRWHILLALIVIFIVGYLAYTWAFWDSATDTFDLIVPGVFFLGACFVWLTVTLALQTTESFKRLNLLERENIIDPLTGVYNRRFLDCRLNEEVARASRHEQPLTVLLIDIDKFKLVNDNHGHQIGDQVLVIFAKLIKQKLREPDILVRYGGEEFMVIAPHTNGQGGAELANRLRVKIAAHRFLLTNVGGGTLELSLTCSIGVANLCEEIDCTEKLVHVVDQNLYRAKRDGRNRVNADKPVVAGTNKETMKAFPILQDI